MCNYNEALCVEKHQKIETDTAKINADIEKISELIYNPTSGFSVCIARILVTVKELDKLKWAIYTILFTVITALVIGVVSLYR